MADQQTCKRWLSKCEEVPDIDSFLKAPRLVNELVLLHLNNWVYRLTWFPLEIQFKNSMGWLMNASKSLFRQELRLHIFVSFQNFLNNDWGYEDLTVLLLYWQQSCTVVLDCACTIRVRYTNYTGYYIADDVIDCAYFEQLTQAIPITKLVLDYSNVFFRNGWESPPSDWAVSTRMRARIERATNRHH